MTDLPITHPSMAARLLRVMAIMLVFMALGPAVGGVSLIMMIAVAKMGVTWDLTTVALFGLIYGVVFAYLAGIVPAAVAGLLIGLWQAFVGRVRWSLALSLGLLVGVAFMYFVTHARPPDEQSEFSELHVILILSCVLPTMVCWLLVRTWSFDEAALRGTAA